MSVIATIEQDLDEFANLEAKMDVLRMQERQDIDELLSDEIQAEIDVIKAECAIQLGETQRKLALLKEQIKSGVLTTGVSATGQFKQAVWNKGRVSWDSKGLSGYKVAHPEIGTFEKVGNPTVSFRNVKA